MCIYGQSVTYFAFTDDKNLPLKMTYIPYYFSHLTFDHIWNSLKQKIDT